MLCREMKEQIEVILNGKWIRGDTLSFSAREVVVLYNDRDRIEDVILRGSGYLNDDPVVAVHLGLISHRVRAVEQENGTIVLLNKPEGDKMRTVIKVKPKYYEDFKKYLKLSGIQLKEKE